MPTKFTGGLAKHKPRSDDREFQRIEPDEEVGVSLRVAVDAKVVDAGSGGVGVLLDDIWGIRIGDELLLANPGEGGEVIDLAVVRNVRLQDDGRWRLGLEWKGSQT